MTSSLKTDRKGGIFTTQTDSLCASCYLNNQMKSRERHSSLLCFLRRFGIWTWSLWSTKTESSLEKIFERFLWFTCLFCHHYLLWFYRCDWLLLSIFLLQIAQPVEDGFGSRLGTSEASSMKKSSEPTHNGLLAATVQTFGWSRCSLFHSRGFPYTCWGYEPLYLSYVEHQPCFKVPFGGTICYNTRLNVCVSQRFTDSTRRDDCLWF